MKVVKIKVLNFFLLQKMYTKESHVATPLAALRAGGLGGVLRPPAGFGAEPRKLSDFKQFESRWRHLRAYKMMIDASKNYDKKREKLEFYGHWLNTAINFFL